MDNTNNMKISNLEVTGNLTSPTLSETVARLEKTIADQAITLNSKIDGLDAKYVHKDKPFSLIASWKQKQRGAGKDYNGPVIVSDHYLLRARDPINDTRGQFYGQTYSIKQPAV